MNGKPFFKTGSPAGTATLLYAGNAFAQKLAHNPIDKFVEANGNYIQQVLPYNKKNLEPYMDAGTTHLHYRFHHGGAVKAGNNDLHITKKALNENNLEKVNYWIKKLSYHFSLPVLHSIFRTNFTNKKTAPAGYLLKRIIKNFGSSYRLKAWIADTSKNVDGNGWGIVAYQPYSDSLTVLQCENHEKLANWRAVSLLVIDVWKHAYNLKYKNNGTDFADALFNILNPDNIAQRLDTAIKITKEHQLKHAVWFDVYLQAN